MSTAGSPHSPSHTPRLVPARFEEQEEPASFTQPPANPTDRTSLFGREPEHHWSIQKAIDPSKYLTLFARLPHKLSATNYISWMFAAEATLDTIDLLGYINGKIPAHRSDNLFYPNWRAANALVRSILITNMSEEVAVQMSHLRVASEIWSEARRLFSGQTMTDFTLTITSLVTTKYIDGEDISAHIAKMKGFHRDLMLMNRDIDDGLFGCFLRISMPPTWNYVFAGLPQSYTSAEVERRIKDEHGIKTNQESVAMAYRAVQMIGKSNETSPGDPFCTNCNKPGHWIKGCWSKGGGAEGKGPRQKRNQKKKNDNKGKKNKGKDKANQATHDHDSDSESRVSHASYMAVNTSSSSSSQLRWILDGGSTTHICNDRSAFTKFSPSHDTIGSIQKNGPQLQVHGTGEIKIICSVKGHDDQVITFRDVAFCPDARDNLVSESRMDRKGMEIRKRSGKVSVIKPNGELLMQGKLRGRLYELDCLIAHPSAIPSNIAFSAQYGQSLDLWHR